MARVVVVGGGIAGAAAAWYLRDHAVTVIDGASQVGGKLRTTDVAGLAVDEGAEQLLVRRPEAVALAREVGLGEDLVHPLTSSAAVWARGRLRPLPPRTPLGVPSSTRTLGGVVAPWQRARVARYRVLAGTTPVEDMSVAAFVEHRVGCAMVARLVEPLV